VRQIFPGAHPRLGPADPLRLAGRFTADTPGAAELIKALAEFYAYPEDANGGGRGAWVRANMIASLDGAISVKGRSSGLSGDADRLVFSVLRGLADVVLVGAGTARTERYGLAKPSWPQLRQGRPATPPIAVVTSRLGLDLDSHLVRGGPSLPRTIVLTTRQAPADRVAAAARTADVIVMGDDHVSGRATIEKLAELGHRRILTEGGPHLLGEIAADDLLDELCVTISPLIEGGHAGRMITSRSTFTAGLELAGLLEDDGFLLSRYVRAR
jgi:riboflavin biosynthesis pyrimidine reductase